MGQSPNYVYVRLVICKVRLLINSFLVETAPSRLIFLILSLQSLEGSSQHSDAAENRRGGAGDGGQLGGHAGQGEERGEEAGSLKHKKMSKTNSQRRDTRSYLPSFLSLPWPSSKLAPPPAALWRTFFSRRGSRVRTPLRARLTERECRQHHR